MRKARRGAHVNAELFTPPAEPPAGYGPVVEPLDPFKPFEPFDPTVAEVWADGGVMEINPSPVGGTWAYRHVNAAGGVVAEDSGYIHAEPGKFITNNFTEFLALLLALEALPYHWSGKVYTDSGVTLTRFENPTAVGMKGIPEEYVTRLLNLRRFLGALHFVLVGGHPTRAELGAGRRKDGKPCGIHNVWCDNACNIEKHNAAVARAEAGRRFDRVTAPPVIPCVCNLLGDTCDLCRAKEGAHV